MSTDEIRDNYSKSSIKYKYLTEREERILLYLSVTRFFTFIAGLILIFLGFRISLISGFIVIPLITVLFLYLLKLYSLHSGKKDFLTCLTIINRNESNALSGDLSAFEDGSSYSDPGHDFSNDVDLFGISSLFQYLNRTVTCYGRDILAAWLSNPLVHSGQLTARQETITELAGKIEWRHKFMASGMNKPLDKEHIISLLDWMNESQLIKSSYVRKILIYLLPSVTCLSLILVVSGLLHYSVFTFFFLVNLLYIATGLKKINKIHNVLSRKYIYLASINELLKVFENESFNSKILIEIKKNISGAKVSAAVSVNRLNHLIEAFDTRMNFIAGFVLNGVLLWDYHSILRLEKWKSENKDLFPVWLEMLGQVDAFISLGNYACNNPGFTYPLISENGNVFSARDLGHQLIDENIRVCNDFELHRPGTVCIITGANMAGKSTFLRTVAVNYILAITGAPVCAKEMSFIPFRLFTSMRTTDSLTNNESYFYAELKRLKLLKSSIEKGDPILFILDEILKGTNSADKSLGSKLFLKRLVELGGSGLIATHDISLGAMEKDFPETVFNKCFEIDIDGEIIYFDYKLQDGITHNMNAALLMKQMGILD